MQVNYEDLSDGCKHLDTNKRLWCTVRCVDCNELMEDIKERKGIDEALESVNAELAKLTLQLNTVIND